MTLCLIKYVSKQQLHHNEYTNTLNFSLTDEIQLCMKFMYVQMAL